MNTSNEILIESVQLDLLVTEGMVDKAKGAFKTVIEKIKALFTKISNYVKEKLAKIDSDILEKALDVIKGFGGALRLEVDLESLGASVIIAKILGGLHSLAGQVAKIPGMSEDKVKPIREKLLDWKDMFERVSDLLEKDVTADISAIGKGISSTIELIKKGASAIGAMASAGIDAAKQCSVKDVSAIHVQTVQLYSSLVAKLLAKLNWLKAKAKSIASKTISAVNHA
jgi:hypothetical protein